MSGATFTSIPPEQFRRTPWKNGGGVTIDIADAYREGATAGSWQGVIWRLGRTSIVAPGPFSDFTGFERLQTVITGHGLVLETPAGEIDLRRALTVARYDGGMPIMSRLEGGPVEVVNLIADRALCTIDLRIVTASERVALEPGTHIAYASDCNAAMTWEAREITLAAGHALRIEVANRADLTVQRGTAVLASISAR